MKPRGVDSAVLSNLPVLKKKHRMLTWAVEVSHSQDPTRSFALDSHKQSVLTYLLGSVDKKNGLLNMGNQLSLTVYICSFDNKRTTEV